MKLSALVLVSTTLCGAGVLQAPCHALAQEWTGLPTTNKPVNLPSHLKVPSLSTVDVLEGFSAASDYSSGAVPEGTWVIPGELTAGASVKPDIEVPLAEDKMILSFDPDIGEGIHDIVEDYDLTVLSASPETAQMTIQYDLGKYLKPRTGEDTNETLSRALVDAMTDYQAIPGVEIAAPSTFSFAQDDVVRLEAATVASPEVVSEAQEVVDWGVADIEAEALWTLNGANDGAIFGVLDVGFGRHEDLAYMPLSANGTIDDHGTHVAGVACALHNQVGVRGVLPNCFVKAVHSRRIFVPEDGMDAEIEFVLVSLNEINQALIEFLDEDSDARTFNVSLGANWRRLRINPETDPLWRTIISQQGATLARPLLLAAQADKVVFSAAGNDSRPDDIQNPRYSSALNYAILQLREEGYSAGLIVSAHDKQGAKAPFSNAPADISCPGVDILSTIAFNGRDRSERAYGLMSGTSMATPYCASGFALLSLVLPDLEPAEILRCMVESGQRDAESIPRLKLLRAYEQCSGA